MIKQCSQSLNEMLDIEMPVLNGLQAAKQLKERHENLKGLAYLSPAMARAMIQEYLSQKDFATKTRDILTLREQEVFKLIAEGFSNREIAQKLIISLKTVQSHRSHIMEKLNLNNRLELMKYAIRKGVVSV